MGSKNGAQKTIWPGAVDHVVGAVVLVFVCLISLFAIRNNDIWWHLAVGRELILDRSFITSDPFMFSEVGIPWVPHAWLSDVIFYLVHAALSTPGLVVLRALLVCTIFFFLARLLRRLRISLTLAAPVLLLVALNAHSRFIIRPHLLEYLFIVLLLGYLITPRDWNRGRVLVFPIILQILWVNLHASFYLGPVIVFFFFVGEWLSARLSRPVGTRPVLSGPGVPLSRAMLVVALMGAASFINPSPREFVFQPLSPEHRHLLTQYTLEWLSPFDSVMRDAAFHPYYEYLLVLAVVAFLWSATRLKLSSLLLVGFFAAMSLNAHRFRVEFGLVALPLILDQLRDAPLTEKLRRRLSRNGAAGKFAPYVLCLFASAVLIYTARDRILIEGSVSDRYPREAFRFVREQGVANRPFHTVGFGSFLLWDLYPERKSFIDGRNISVDLHRAFFATQTVSAAFNRTIRQFELDAFIVPAPERSDGGMRNVHNFLIASKGWDLTYMDRVAYVYVKKKKVPPEWASRHAYRFYHPMTFEQLRISAAQVDSVAAEFARAVETDPRYVRPLLDSARFRAAMGDREAAVEMLEKVLAIEPASEEAKALVRSLR